MTNWLKAYYQTKVSNNGIIINCDLSEHLEIEHGLHYFDNMFDMIDLAIVHKIHKSIHEAYFLGMADAAIELVGPNDEIGAAALQKRFFENYTFASLNQDIELCLDEETQPLAKNTTDEENTLTMYLNSTIWSSVKTDEKSILEP